MFILLILEYINLLKESLSTEFSVAFPLVVDFSLMYTLIVKKIYVVIFFFFFPLLNRKNKKKLRVRFGFIISKLWFKNNNLKARSQTIHFLALLTSNLRIKNCHKIFHYFGTKKMSTSHLKFSIPISRKIQKIQSDRIIVQLKCEWSSGDKQNKVTWPIMLRQHSISNYIIKFFFFFLKNIFCEMDTL